MAQLIKKRNKYYSRIRVRVGNYTENKRKESYISLDTTIYREAKTRNAIVNREEESIRKEIRKGEATKSDLLNLKKYRVY